MGVGEHRGRLATVTCTIHSGENQQISLSAWSLMTLSKFHGLNFKESAKITKSITRYIGNIQHSEKYVETTE